MPRDAKTKKTNPTKDADESTSKKQGKKGSKIVPKVSQRVRGKSRATVSKAAAKRKAAK